MIGWANVSVKRNAVKAFRETGNSTLQVDLGYIASAPPRGRLFRQALDEELDRLRVFLGLRT